MKHTHLVEQAQRVVESRLWDQLPKRDKIQRLIKLARSGDRQAGHMLKRIVKQHGVRPEQEGALAYQMMPRLQSILRKRMTAAVPGWDVELPPTKATASTVKVELHPPGQNVPKMLVSLHYSLQEKSLHTDVRVILPRAVGRDNARLVRDAVKSFGREFLASSMGFYTPSVQFSKRLPGHRISAADLKGFLAKTAIAAKTMAKAVDKLEQ